MINYPFANLSSKGLLVSPHGILHIHGRYQSRENACFPAEPYHITAISSLAKTNAAAHYNYEHFTKIMAKMVQKYGSKIN